MNTTRVLRKQNNNMVTRTRPRSTAKTSLMSKVPSKINNFEGLEKVCHKFSQTFLWKRHNTPHLDRERSAKYRYSSNMAEHDSSHISSLTILDQTTKGQIPTLNLPSFQKHFLISIFFQIWRFSFWRLFSVGDSIARFREIRLTSRPEIRSDSGSDGPLTALTTPMI